MRSMPAHCPSLKIAAFAGPFRDALPHRGIEHHGNDAPRQLGPGSGTRTRDTWLRHRPHGTDHRGGLQVVENWNSANTVLHYGKDGALTGPDKEHAEASMLALHLLQSALVHVNTLLVQQVLAEQAWASRLSDEDRRGLTALFWSNVNPYGTFRLDMDKRLDLGPAVTVPGPRAAADSVGIKVLQPTESGPGR
ncbi:Tn3 family transposase [Streptomyces sp. NPDC001933]|uniref:Tn3 family transposase n=1 Tax=Streptomyces sp. NPDC001933 TaxID=3364626 RepID=UPI0036B48CD3